jgi:hypothetical protein
MIPFETIRKTTADRIDDATIIIQTGMDEYSGWDVEDHLRWVSELSGLNYFDLSLLVERGYLVLTDESVSVVWLVSSDYYKSTARLIYLE